MTHTANTRQAALLVAGAVIALAAASQAGAAAFYIQEQSTKAIGRAFSGEVSEMGAQQQWWNPAAVGGVGSFQSYAGFTAILPTADATNRGSTITRSAFPLGAVPGLPPLPGGLPYPSIAGSTVAITGNENVHNMVNNGYLPNGGFAIPLPGGFAFGFTATSPYSFTTNYDPTDWARYSADKSRLRTFDFQPSLAWSNGHVSFGAGPNVEYVRATLSNYLPDPLANVQTSLVNSLTGIVGPTLGAAIGNGFGAPLSAALNTGDGHQYLKGSGWDVGYSLGFQFHNDQADIGVSCKSAIKHKLNGHLIIDGLTGILATEGVNQRVDGAIARFTTPWQVNFGARYHVSPKLTLNGQITRFGWDKFSAIRLSNLDANPDQAIPENYHNSWSFAGGFDYKISPKLTWRAGVQRDLSPIGDGDRDPRVPDGNRWNFATGGSYEMTSRMGLDAAFSYDWIQSATIDRTTTAYAGTPLETTIQNNGILHNARAIVVSLGGHVAF
jgi:long-chain fatty acid transport protein